MHPVGAKLQYAEIGLEEGNQVGKIHSNPPFSDPYRQDPIKISRSACCGKQRMPAGFVYYDRGGVLRLVVVNPLQIIVKT